MSYVGGLDSSPFLLTRALTNIASTMHETRSHYQGGISTPVIYTVQGFCQRTEVVQAAQRPQGRTFSSSIADVGEYSDRHTDVPSVLFY
jgi:hypothetical protein